MCRLRGGGTSSSEESEEEEDDGMFDADEDEGAVDEEDFGEANFVDRLRQDWANTPIITKTFFQVRTSFWCRAMQFYHTVDDTQYFQIIQ